MSHLAQRCRAQLLSGPAATSPEHVAERLLAVQAQDPRGARLAVRARSTGVQAADVDTALTVDRSLVVSWLNRGTLHLVRSEDLPLLHAVTTPQLHTANARRLQQEGVSASQAEAAMRRVESALLSGPQSRAQLREALADAGVPTAGQATVHLLMRACLHGLAVRGPVIDGEQAFVLARDWLEVPLTPPVDRDVALVELARRYLLGHAPASAHDLAMWAGIGVGDARRALRGVRGVRDVGNQMLSLSAPDPCPFPPPRLLGPFDPLLLGWVDRSPVLGPHAEQVTRGGVFRPFALVEGRAVATWSVGGGADLQPFSPLEPEVIAALEADRERVQHFLGSRRYR